MKPLIFRGYSDDTFGEYGRTNDDYDNSANGDLIVFKVHVPNALDLGLYVWGHYSPKGGPQTGCWVIGVQQLDEGIPLPSWPMRFETHKEGDRIYYSPNLIIDAPGNVVVEHVKEAE